MLIKLKSHCFLLMSVIALTCGALTGKASANNGEHILDIQTWQTQKGTPVYFVAAPELPMLDIRVAFAAGSAHDGNQYGLAFITNNLLDEGTVDLTAEQIAEQFDEVGALFDNDVDQDKAVLSLRTLTEPQNLKPALKLFSSIIAKPKFAATDIARIKQQIDAALAQQKQSPAAMAELALYQTIFKNHPYAHQVLGNQESLTRLNASIMKTFHQQYYVARNATIVLVGAITRGQAEQIAEQLMREIPQGQKANAIVRAENATIREEKNIPMTSAQTAIRIGQVGISPDNSDYFPLIVANHILGGVGLVSRLNEEVREKRGLSYSVYSHFKPLIARGPFIIALETRNTQANNALTVVQRALNDFIAKGPSVEELNQAKQNLTGSFPLRLANNALITDNLLNLAFYQLPLDYFDTYRDQINQVTLTKLRAAVQKTLFPRDMAVVKTVMAKPDATTKKAALITNDIAPTSANKTKI